MSRGAYRLWHPPAPRPQALRIWQYNPMTAMAPGRQADLAAEAGKRMVHVVGLVGTRYKAGAATAQRRQEWRLC